MQAALVRNEVLALLGSPASAARYAMYLCQEAGGITLQIIAQHFGLQRYGTVSTTIGKLKQLPPRAVQYGAGAA